MVQQREDREQRQEFRLAKALTVFIELPSHMDREPEIVISRCCDVSANGLRVTADRELPLSGIVRTCVQAVDAADARFVLICEVQWVRYEASTGAYLTGLKLFDSDNSDIIEWKTYIANIVTGANQEDTHD